MHHRIRVLIRMSIALITLFFGERTLAQSEDLFEGAKCLYNGTDDSTRGVEVLQDTSLRVAILFVQFADWETRLDARGSVGYTDYRPQYADTVFRKFRYPDYWNMYFSKNSYIDSLEVQPPITHHPDYLSHGIEVSGSFRDFYWETSHKNLDTSPAVTHPAETDTMFRSGIINRFRPDSSVIWITLPHDHAYYDYGGSMTGLSMIISHGVAAAHALYPDSLNVDVQDQTIIDRVLVCYAGPYGWAIAYLNGRYCVFKERVRYSGQTDFLYGFGVFAHEFGHLIGFPDYHGFTANTKFSSGLGNFSIMARGQYDRNSFSPNHLDAWNKLRIGWANYEIVDHDTTNYSLLPVEDTSGVGLPKVGILKGRGLPESGNWAGTDLEYFVMENRSTIGFDETLNFGDPSFPGGMILWHYSGSYDFPNGYRIRVIEADADSANQIGNLAIHPDSAGSNQGSRSDFFPGEQNVTMINDLTLPSLRLQNGDFSRLAMSEIQYDPPNQTVDIDTIQTTAGIQLISSHTVWSGVVNLDENVRITSGGWLELAPGTIISINSSTEDIISIEVEEGGIIDATGNDGSRIVFRSALTNPTKNDWEGIMLKAGSQGIFNYVTFENASTAIHSTQNDTLDIDNCNFQNNNKAIKTSSQPGTLVLRNTSFSTNNSSLTLGLFSFNIFDCMIDNSPINISSGTGSLSGCTLTNSSATFQGGGGTIHHCTFQNSSFTASGNGNLQLYECSFIGGGIISSSTGLFTVQNSLFNNYTGDGVKVNGNVNILNSNFLSVFRGVKVETRPNLPYMGSLSIINNVFVGNDTAIAYTPPEGSVTVKYNDFYSNVYNGYTGTSPVFEDPSFVTPASGDYHLRYESALIDSGDPTSDFSNEPEPNGDRINIGRYGNTSEATITTTPGVTVSGTEQWTGDRYLSGDILIMPGGYLTVDPGATVYFVPNYDATGGGPNRQKGDIVVQGQLTLQGTLILPVTIASYTATPSPGDWGTILLSSPTQTTVQYAQISEATDGITFEREGFGTVSNSTIENCDVGLKATTTISPNISFTNNTLINDSLGIHLFMADAIVDGNTISNNVEGIKVEQGVGYSIRNNTIENNDTYGIHLVQSSDGTLDGNIIQFNGLQDDASVSGGIFLHASSPVLENNTINDNLPHGITAMNRSQPVMNKGGRALNHIEANGTRYTGPGPGQPENAELLFYDSSYPVLSQGHNDIFDLGGGYLIYGKEVVIPTKPVDITYNYWAVEEPALGDRFYPDIFKYIPYDRTPNTGSNPSNPLWSGSQAMYQQGISQETEGNWSGAIETYQNLITTYPDSMEALGSVVRLFVCTGANGGDYQSLQAYYEELKVTYPETQLMKAADQYSILCHLPREEFSAAIEKYETVLSNPPSLEDSVYAVIDIGQVYLIADASGAGGLGRQAPLGTMTQYKPVDHKDYANRVSNALAALFRGNRKEDLAVPERFALHQNYPNPFNPRTTILFDLPEPGDVNLVVYDILGREIATLIDDKLIAGFHWVVWNASQVASGIYFYRLTSEQGIRTRKLVVLK